MLYNENFKANYEYTFYRTRDRSLVYVREEIVAWALFNKVRLKIRTILKEGTRFLNGIVIYFEHQEDLLAFRLKVEVQCLTYV